MAKQVWLVMAVLIAIVFICGCTGQPSPKESVTCPSGLQACGNGCIPANALCCDDNGINSYCLQPTKECGDGICSQCEYGKVFCGMSCIDSGAQCCFDGECKELIPKTPVNQQKPEEKQDHKLISVDIENVIVSKTGPVEQCFSGECAEITIDITGTAYSDTAAKLRVALISYPDDYSTYMYDYETFTSGKGKEYVNAVGSAVKIISDWTEENDGYVAKAGISDPMNTTWSAQYTSRYTKGKQIMILADLASEVDGTVIGRVQETRIITPFQ